MDTETFNPEQNSKIIIPLKTHYHIKMEEPENNLDYDTFKKTINIVNLSYRNCKFDPISVKSNEEARHLNIYFKYKIKERESKDQSENGRSAGSQFYPSSEVVRAQSALPPHIISYLNRSFTKKGLKDLQRKSGEKQTRRYPKRSEIIKINKIQDSPKKVENALINHELRNEFGRSDFIAQAAIQVVARKQKGHDHPKIENDKSNRKFDFESNDWYHCLHCHSHNLLKENDLEKHEELFHEHFTINPAWFYKKLDLRLKDLKHQKCYKDIFMVQNSKH